MNKFFKIFLLAGIVLVSSIPTSRAMWNPFRRAPVVAQPFQVMLPLVAGPQQVTGKIGAAGAQNISFIPSTAHPTLLIDHGKVYRLVAGTQSICIQHGANAIQLLQAGVVHNIFKALINDKAIDLSVGGNNADFKLTGDGLQLSIAAQAAPTQLMFGFEAIKIAPLNGFSMGKAITYPCTGLAYGLVLLAEKGIKLPLNFVLMLKNFIQKHPTKTAIITLYIVARYYGYTESFDVFVGHYLNYLAPVGNFLYRHAQTGAVAIKGFLWNYCPAAISQYIKTKLLQVFPASFCEFFQLYVIPKSTKWHWYYYLMPWQWF